MRMIKRLRSRRGESFAELLFAVLVMSLASALLATVVGASATVNAKAKEQQAKLNDELEVAEKADSISTSMPLAVSVDGQTVSFTVKLYGTTDGLYAYFPEVTP